MQQLPDLTCIKNFILSSLLLMAINANALPAPDINKLTTPAPLPIINNATYDASTGVFIVTGFNFRAISGIYNEAIVTKLTLTGEAGSNYTLTSASVEIKDNFYFTFTLNATDKVAINLLLNNNGTSSTDAMIYNLAAAEDWMTAISVSADLTDNGVTVSNACTLPPAPTASGVSIYSGNSASLTATGTGTIGWYSAAIGGTYLGGGSSFTTPAISISTTYYVQDSTCLASETRTSVTVNVILFLNSNGQSSTNRSTSLNGNGAIGKSTISANGKITNFLAEVASTTAASWIGWYDAISGGNIISDGGNAITARGVCWSISTNPTTADSKTTDGSGTGVFTSYLAGLNESTHYYVRAYATTIVGTAYGTEIDFTTGRSCFIAGTKITMQDGTFKNIEDIVIGEVVKSVDVSNMEVTNKVVTKVFAHPPSYNITKITFSNGQSNTNTKSHPYWVDGKGWCSVNPETFKNAAGINTKQLKVGDTCRFVDKGILVTVTVLSIDNLPTLFVPTYNFDVEITKCYFANGILVHNYQ
jgi:hypothetical protein